MPPTEMTILAARHLDTEENMRIREGAQLTRDDVAAIRQLVRYVAQQAREPVKKPAARQLPGRRSYETYARCAECGDLEHDGTAASADKVTEKHTKTTGHATGCGYRLVR